MKNLSLFLCFVFLLCHSCKETSHQNTRGIGVYPGNPDESFAPEILTDNDRVTNVARLRPAYHSSSYDYNLTAQLITDGIVTNDLPHTISMATQTGEMPKIEREWLFDHNSITTLKLEGSEVFIQLGMQNCKQLPQISTITLNGTMQYDKSEVSKWLVTCYGSYDGTTWEQLGKHQGDGLPGIEKPNPWARYHQMMAQQKKGDMNKSSNSWAGLFGNQDPDAPKPSFSYNIPEPKDERIIDESFSFEEPVFYSFYKVLLQAGGAMNWLFGDLDFYSGPTRLKMAPSHSFTSTWMSASPNEEWVYVDLGTEARYDKVTLHWIRNAAKGKIQVSDDAITWNSVCGLPESDDLVQEIELGALQTKRYLRVFMEESLSGAPYLLSELEVTGTGAQMAKPRKSPAIVNNVINLSGGNWVLQRSSVVNANGEALSKVSYKPDGWVAATVPGTVLTSYYNIGALPDPNYGDNQLMISESFFNSDFWYRNTFDVPADFKKEKLFLNFDGINWKADVFVNGSLSGHIDGGFMRGKFDITGLITPGQTNALAVLIHKNDNIGIVKEQTAITPDKNGGVLGGDNPTFHASIGWDWIPTIRGRNIGIWNDVFVSTSGLVTIEDPLVLTDLPLPDTTQADVSVEVNLVNHSEKEVTGNLKGKYGPVVFEQAVSLSPASQTVVKLDGSTHPQLQLKQPLLWWPKGYGAPYLYDVELVFEDASGNVSDITSFKSGVREMSFKEENGILSLFVNGRRFIGRGGNWGFPESNLNYRGREYDIAVAYHADMNFTMIRNWVGQTGDREFYEACDRHGIMVWQDFWLANPVDGPNPYDPEMFLTNARDYIKRIRNHPSIAIYIGRNEGNPPVEIDTALMVLVKELHPGLHYTPHSSAGPVSGGGPYRALPVRDYFLLFGNDKFHSERGMPNVMTYESLKQTLPESKLWPQNSQWGIHDYCLEGAQAAASFNQIIEKAFGPIDNAKKFTELAQWINYDGYRGIFEGRSQHRKGMLLWMSHPAWPSMVWQTYDYYFEPTAAYFGCKKANEPLHIQWNPVYDFVEVVNYHANNRKGLVAKASVINMDGSVQWRDSTTIDSNEDSTVKCFNLQFPESLSAVHFIKLVLLEGDNVVSENFYWRGLETGNYQALNNLPAVKLDCQTRAVKEGEKWRLTTTIKNPSNHPALMIRLQVVGEKDNNRILPVFFSDNYVSLMPGEEKVVVMQLKAEDARGQKPEVEVSGFNVEADKAQI